MQALAPEPRAGTRRCRGEPARALHVVTASYGPRGRESPSRSIGVPPLANHWRFPRVRTGVATHSPHVLPGLRCNGGPVATTLLRGRVAQPRARIDLRERLLAPTIGHEERIETKAMRPDQTVALAFCEPAHGF